MSNDEIELIIDEFNTKYYVLKNSNLDKSNKNIRNLNVFLKILSNKLYYDGKLIHREDGPAIEYKNGNNFWYFNGLLHRLYGPAIGLHRTKEWFKNGLLHRLDGPAIESINGHKEYWINGFQISEENFYLEKELRSNLTNNNKFKKNKI